MHSRNIVHLCVSTFQDFGLNVEAFSKLVLGCPQKVLELSANCCQVSMRDCKERIYSDGAFKDGTVDITERDYS